MRFFVVFIIRILKEEAVYSICFCESVWLLKLKGETITSMVNIGFILLLLLIFRILRNY